MELVSIQRVGLGSDVVYLTHFVHLMKINSLVPCLVGLLASVGMPSETFGQELAPDDASIAGSLQLWLRNAAGNFDEGSGVWSDSSGKGNDATTIGDVNVNGLVTYLAPTLTTTPGGNFSAEDVPAVTFSATVDDLMGTPGLNGGAGMDSLTIFAVYNITTLGGNPNLTRPLGIGSISATQANPGNHVNLSSDPSIRKDNGQLGSGQYSEPFPAGTLFIRSTRMSATAVDDWFNTDGTLTKVFTVSGVSYTTSVDEFYLGDLRGGASTVPGFGAAAAPSDFDIVQVAVYNSALTDDQVAGVNEWLAGNLLTKSRLNITEITHDSGTGNLSISWESAEGLLYNVRSATDLSSDPGTWPIFDSKMDLPATAPLNTEVFTLPADKERYFVVESFPKPPVVVLSENFDAGPGDWTTGVDDLNNNTLWELGIPSVIGPLAANSPPNCFGTNIAGDYLADANIWLRSPPIDLTAAGSATLSFFHYVDTEGDPDFGRVAVLDADNGDAELAVIETSISGILDWTKLTRAMPAEALGKNIKLEFRFQSDTVLSFGGWYIDDVEVITP